MCIFVCGRVYTELFISPSGISEIDCATTKTDTAERNISIGRESFQDFFVLGALAFDTFRGYFFRVQPFFISPSATAVQTHYTNHKSVFDSFRAAVKGCRIIRAV
jgi:hypothetical protein